MAIQRRHSGARISRVVIHGDIVYLAGLVALERRGGVKEQTQAILAHIDKLLAEAGTDKSKLLTAIVWLSDIREAEAMNEVWEEWIPEGCAPARSTVEGKLTSPHYAVKIAVTAAR